MLFCHQQKSGVRVAYLLTHQNLLLREGCLMTFAMTRVVPVTLRIEPDLIGASHQFRFEGRDVIVKLPSQYYNKHDPKTKKSFGKSLECSTWKKGTNAMVALDVKKLDVTISLTDDDGVTFTEDMLEDTDNSQKLFMQSNPNIGPAEKQLSAMVDRVFDYWCRIVRWKTSYSYFGTPIDNSYFGEGVLEFVSLDPRKTIAIFGGVVVSRPKPLPGDYWASFQRELTNSAEPPLWIDMIHDATRRRITGDIRGALIDTAVALEAFLRNEVRRALDPLPQDEKAIRKRIESWNTGDILKNLSKISSTDALGVTDAEARLFKISVDKRNALMHGKKAELSEQEVRKFISAVASLFSRSAA